MGNVISRVYERSKPNDLLRNEPSYILAASLVKSYVKVHIQVNYTLYIHSVHTLSRTYIYLAHICFVILVLQRQIFACTLCTISLISAHILDALFCDGSFLMLVLCTQSSSQRYTYPLAMEKTNFSNNISQRHAKCVLI